jgi:2-dehydropantoate 2-reductase
MMLIVGAGAVGTILAAYAAKAEKNPLRLYVRDMDLDAVQGVEQICVDHVLGGRPALKVAKPTLTQTLDLRDVDYLLICVKYPDLDSVLDALPTIPPHCTIVPTLNGVSGLRRIHERFPDARVAPMTIMFNGQWLAPLHARITTRPQVLVGSRDAVLLGAFEGSGMAVEVIEGEAAIWGKLLINLGNAICAATHATFKDLITHPDLKACYFQAFDEAADTLKRAGVPFTLPMQVPLKLYQLLFRRGGPLVGWLARTRNGLQAGSYPSMVADVQQGRPTEVMQLNGEIVALAERGGRDAPINRRLCELINNMVGVRTTPLTPGELRERLRIDRNI